jgi:predicted RNA-binding protein YlqC (UPF0109 family)
MTDRNEMDVQELLLQIVRSIVDQPDEVSIDSAQRPDETIFRVKVHPTDVGKVIGKQGRMARALRIIAHANGVLMKRKLGVDIVDAQGRTSPMSFNSEEQL